MSRVGTFASGLTARYSALCCSPLASDTNRRSKSTPISCNAMCAAIELDPGEKYSVSMKAPLVVRRSASDGGRWQLHEAVHCGRVGPARYRDDIVLRIDPGQITAGAARIVAPPRGARIKRAPGVEPPEVAVVGVERAGLQHPRDPSFREDTAAAPNAAAQQQQPDPRLVAGADEHPAAPMPTAGDRLHSPAVDLDIGIAVAVPLPLWRRADRVHHELAEHLG